MNLQNESGQDIEQSVNKVEKGVEAVKTAKKVGKAVGTAKAVASKEGAKAGIKAFFAALKGGGAAAASIPAIMTILFWVIVALLALFVICFVIVFLIAMPSSILSTMDSFSNDALTDLYVGWEEQKAELGASFDDFVTLLRTGTSGDSLETFKTDVAAAEDSDFADYMGVSNSLVAILNYYFRDTYQKIVEEANTRGENKGQEEKTKAMNGEIAIDESVYSGYTFDNVTTFKADVTSFREEDITVNVNGMDASSSNYVEWALYILACDSVENIQDDSGGTQLNRAKTMIAAAKDIVSASQNENVSDDDKLWVVKINTTQTQGSKTIQETRTTETSKEIDYYHGHYTADGTDFVRDRRGQIIEYPPNDGCTETSTTTTTVNVVYPTITIEVTVNVIANTSNFETFLYNEYPVAGDTSGGADWRAQTGLGSEDDMSNKEIVESEVDILRTIYAASVSELIGEQVATGQVLELIQEFYANHSDLIFDGPTSVQGPFAGWRHYITSHLGATDIAEHTSGHNGTDVSSANGTPLSISSKAIVAAVTNAYANVRDDSVPRGNFVLLYYGERGGVTEGEQKGIFVLYQHLSIARVSEGQALDPGTVSTILCGQSGTATGPHWHIEAYVGTTKQPESFLLD